MELNLRCVRHPERLRKAGQATCSVYRPLYSR